MITIFVNIDRLSCRNIRKLLFMENIKYKKLLAYLLQKTNIGALFEFQ